MLARGRPPPHMRARDRAPDMMDNKNTLLAIVLSALVLIGWQYFVGMPQLEKQKQEQAQQEQAKKPQPGQTGTPMQAPAQPGAGPQLPGQAAAPAGQPLTRDAAIAASPRVRIDTPSLQG